ncbi:amphi-Trp domain-containing protein [Streptomyces asoensis]|uniref:amphi-Trp domain-containing protein n=1 Tax=Streptomyces asoensis TaxID=249586 RepID=UPI0037ADCF0A
MKDLKFEQKSSLSRVEAADRLTALADALREGGDAEVELGGGTLSLRIPDDLRAEIEVEVGGGEIELEIEFKWPTASARSASARTAPARTGPSRSASSETAGEKEEGAEKGTEKPAPARRKAAPAQSGRSGTGSSRTRTAKRTPSKAS